MTREECTAHLSSGLFNHVLLITTALSSLSTNPLISESLEFSANFVRSDGGGHGPELSSTATGRLVDAYGFLDGGVVGTAGGYGGMGGGRADDKLMSLVTGVQNKIEQLEKNDFHLRDTLVSLEADVSSLKKRIFVTLMKWKISNFAQRMDDARTGKYNSIFSLPFYSSSQGYKMCLRLYILGDGIGKGTHMSLFFVVMKGEFDNILQWPFTHKVTFKLINQCGARDVVDVLQPDPLSSSFQKPKSDMNVASGCPRFVSMNELMQDGFIVDDTIFIKVKVDMRP